MEHQRTRASWTLLSTPDEQLQRIRFWRSEVLEAEAKKAERASEDTRLILNPPSRTERFTEDCQGENYKWPKRPHGGYFVFLTEDGHCRVYIEGYVGVSVH